MAVTEMGDAIMREGTTTMMVTTGMAMAITMMVIRTVDMAAKGVTMAVAADMAAAAVITKNLKTRNLYVKKISIRRSADPLLLHG